MTDVAFGWILPGTNDSGLGLICSSPSFPQQAEAAPRGSHQALPISTKKLSTLTCIPNRQNHASDNSILQHTYFICTLLCLLYPRKHS